MQLKMEESGDVQLVRVLEAKLTYPILAGFFAEVRQRVEGGARKLLIDLQAVTYIDSASIGCLMDIHRLLQEQVRARSSSRAAAARRDDDLDDGRAQDHRDPPRGAGRARRAGPSGEGKADA